MNKAINEPTSLLKKFICIMIQVISYIFCFVFPSVGFYVFERYITEVSNPRVEGALFYVAVFYISIIKICIIKNFKCAKVLTASFLTIPIAWIVFYAYETDENLYEHVLFLIFLAVVTSLKILTTLISKNKSEKKKIFIFFIRLSSIIVFFLS